MRAVSGAKYLIQRSYTRSVMHLQLPYVCTEYGPEEENTMGLCSVGTLVVAMLEIHGVGAIALKV